MGGRSLPCGRSASFIKMSRGRELADSVPGWLGSCPSGPAELSANPSPLREEDVQIPDRNWERIRHFDCTPAFNFEGIPFFSEPQLLHL